jgi:hypothetical protein
MRRGAGVPPAVKGASAPRPRGQNVHSRAGETPAPQKGSPDLLFRSVVRGKRRGVRPQISKEVSGIRERALFRSIRKTGRVWGDGMTARVLWQIVREAASRAGTEKLAPHDLCDCVQGQVGIHYASGEFCKLTCRLRTSRAFRGEQC